MAYGAITPTAGLSADRFVYSVVFALGFLLAVTTFLQKPSVEKVEIS